ncbi:Lamin Tail Domain [Haladaptatus litoreus]|uniref:Lamin Tail Domain n=1 Tax=Haladaptatus litoreus TaxID=553468 RepID=A0A1N7E0G7_9EURY|nr:lamin tail domain-containing protein [Haladaptatus litoreus]SIR81622.1 Lamin Tail Domain [Haladaptatus litoreus]
MVVLALLTSAAGFHLVSAQDAALDLDVAEINDEEEYVVIENEGDQSYDLSGLTVSFGDNYERFAFPDGTSIDPGESITVGTGSETATDTDYNAGCDGYVLYNGEPDVVELQDGDTLITASLSDGDDREGGETAPGDDESDDGDDSDDSDDGNDSDDSDDSNDGDDSDDSGESDDNNDSEDDDSDDSDDEESDADC